MILTDKAKQEFILWYLKSEYNFAFDGLPNNLQNALIIEWFDSVGITVDVMPILQNPLKYMPNTFWLEKEYSMNDEGFEYLNTRQEATIKAIEKANEIFNNI